MQNTVGRPSGGAGFSSRRLFQALTSALRDQAASSVRPQLSASRVLPFMVCSKALSKAVLR